MKSDTDNVMIECQDIVKIYKTKDIEVMALQGLTLSVMKGEMMAVIGNSGSGKSTLLNMLGGLDKPTTGILRVGNTDILKAGTSELVRYKREVVGFVWQNTARNLIPYLTAQQNVEIPMIFAKKIDRVNRAKQLLDAVGLSNKKSSKLGHLSGGEQQRVAIAIALSNNPQLVLADEPTGSVDTKTAIQITDTLKRINKEFGVTILIVTHDLKLSKMVDRVVRIRDGRTSSEFIRTNSTSEISSEKIIESPHYDSHQEYIIIDKAGRLQIPGEYIEAAGLSNIDKVKIGMENGNIVIYPPEL